MTTKVDTKLLRTYLYGNVHRDLQMLVSLTENGEARNHLCDAAILFSLAAQNDGVQPKQPTPPLDEVRLPPASVTGKVKFVKPPRPQSASPFSEDGPDVIQLHASRRWYINMGRPGFNSKINNNYGYATEKEASDTLAFYRRCNAGLPEGDVK